jgi:hypothetical protein
MCFVYKLLSVSYYCKCSDRPSLDTEDWTGAVLYTTLFLEQLSDWVFVEWEVAEETEAYVPFPNFSSTSPNFIQYLE